jgi:hypothetical protein
VGKLLPYTAVFFIFGLAIFCLLLPLAVLLIKRRIEHLNDQISAAA